MILRFKDVDTKDLIFVMKNPGDFEVPSPGNTISIDGVDRFAWEMKRVYEKKWFTTVMFCDIFLATKEQYDRLQAANV